MTGFITRRALLSGTSAAVAAVAMAEALRPHRRDAVEDHTAASTVSRWALVVDRAQCARRKGCRACIDACHFAHGVSEQEDIDRDIKWIWKEPARRAFPSQPLSPGAHPDSPVVVLCNHCGSPPCARVCPTGATWQRPDGVVAMDPHRCMGCRYCMAACPYGARSFNWTRTPARGEQGKPGSYPGRTVGVVEKCTLCVDRLDAGLAPRCVEACRVDGAGALTFGDLADPTSRVRHLLATRHTLRRRPELGTRPHVFYLL